MTNEDLKTQITEWLPSATFDETGEWLNVLIDASELLPLAEKLKETNELYFDYLFCVTALDWKTHFSMVYHLESTVYRHTIVVKAKIEDRVNPTIETVSHIWRTAEFHELEAWDLMGIKFKNHPGLRRLFLTDDFNGFPLRKDFEDPINMIKL